ncbi:hypothetical protein [Streptantibioticus ferralitis]|uniref:Uncharacterized protein n=1 Tax=Streptantibioticus ferralitis TaxID=236510 RepID=A0ABT5Z3P5_9ACTN|nr:hypothetical protein [Streptantibioticus ferralitis]MDF2258388.1 hypothetical protein [Streptantibioticus ferralitis]
MNTLIPATDPAELREAVVTRLIGSGHLRTPAVIAPAGKPSATGSFPTSPLDVSGRRSE